MARWVLVRDTSTSMLFRILLFLLHVVHINFYEWLSIDHQKNVTNHVAKIE